MIRIPGGLARITRRSWVPARKSSSFEDIVTGSSKGKISNEQLRTIMNRDRQETIKAMGERTTKLMEARSRGEEPTLAFVDPTDPEWLELSGNAHATPEEFAASRREADLPKPGIKELSSDDTPTEMPSYEEMMAMPTIGDTEGATGRNPYEVFMERIAAASDEVPISKAPDYGVSGPQIAFTEDIARDIERVLGAVGSWADSVDFPLFSGLNLYAVLHYLRKRGIVSPYQAARLGVRIRMGYLNFGKDKLSMRHIWVEHNGTIIDRIPLELQAAVVELGALEYSHKPTGPIHGASGQTLSPSEERADAPGIDATAPQYVASFMPGEVRNNILYVVGFETWRQFRPHLEPFLHGAPPLRPLFAWAGRFNEAVNEWARDEAVTAQQMATGAEINAARAKRLAEEAKQPKARPVDHSRD